MAGALVARVISFAGVSVRVHTHRLSPSQRANYDASAAIWIDLAAILSARLTLLPPSATSRFWSAHQVRRAAVERLHHAFTATAVRAVGNACVGERVIWRDRLLRH
eukprot:1077508-Pleurochrysis_carterae.AAC.1